MDNIFFQAGIPKRISELFMDHNKIVENLVECKTGIYSGDNTRHFRILENTRETNKFKNAGYKTLTEKEIVTNVSKGDEGIFSKLKDNMGLNWNMSDENYVEIDFSGMCS